MTAEADEFRRFTRPLPEPHLLVTAGGDLLAANPAADRVLGLPQPPHDRVPLADRTPDGGARLRAYLRACSGSAAMLPGALELHGTQGPARFRCDGAVVRPAGAGEGPPLILLRLRPSEAASKRFLLLNRTIDNLSQEVHVRQRAEEELQMQAVQLQENAAELEQMVEELELQKLEAQEANRAKSEFLAVMSHELRTPLNAIVGYADLLDAEVEGSLGAGQRGYLDRIKRGAEHLIAIINEILEYARLEAGRSRIKPEPADLTTVVREAVELVEPSAAARGLPLVMDLPDGPVPVETDPAKVRQIVLNLLSNAIKFTDRGRVTVSLVLAKGWANVAVKDSGIGIAQDDLHRVFDPFWQVQQSTLRIEGGTGLGLSVTRGLAHLLGGDVTAASKLGRGSTFTLHLPLRRPAAGAEA